MSPKKRRSPSLVHVIIVIVFALWATSIVVGFLVPAYEPPESLTLITMAVVGPLIGTLVVKGKDEKTDETDRETER